MTAALTHQLIEFIRTDVNPAIGDDLAVDTDLLLTGLVDSLGVVHIVNWMEDELGVDVAPIDVTLENFRTVSAMATFVEHRRGE